MAASAAFESGSTPVDWGGAYTEFLTRSTSYSINTLKLYQSVLIAVSKGQLAPTVFQDRLLHFSQFHGSEFSNRLAAIGARFLSGLVELGATASPDADSNEMPITAPQFDAANPARWSQQLAEYGGQLNAKALRTYRAQLDRVAGGHATPSEVQQTTGGFLSNGLPAYLQKASQLYLNLLNELNEVRAAYEQAYLEDVLKGADDRADPPLILNLSAPLGETAVASLTVSNSTSASTTIRCSVTDVRRADGVGPAFKPKIAISPESIHLAPGEEGVVRLSLGLPNEDYVSTAMHVASLYITGQGEVPAEVQLQIAATHPISGNNAAS